MDGTLVTESMLDSISPPLKESAPMSQRSLLFAAIALLSGSVSSTEPTTKPNILFIFTDDQSYKTVGCYPESAPKATCI